MRVESSTDTLHPDLEHLIHLQELDTAAERQRRRIADIPTLQAALDARLAERTAAVENVKARIAACQAARREIEKDLAVVQGRLSKFKNQLMEVKTNKEYQAMQHEIDGCKAERAALDEKILLEMEEQEKRNTEAHALEGRLKEMRKKTDEGKKGLNDRGAQLQRDKAALDSDREALQKQISAVFLDPFLKTARGKRGIGLVAVRDGLCGGCHVRVMPKLIQEVRRFTQLIACDSCKRFLYVVDDVVASGTLPPAPAQEAETPAGGAGEAADPHVS